MALIQAAAQRDLTIEASNLKQFSPQKIGMSSCLIWRHVDAIPGAATERRVCAQAPR